MPEEPSNDDIKLLEKISAIQSVLSNTHLDIQVLMQLIVNEMQELTPATATVLEVLEGNLIVSKAAAGAVQEYKTLLAKDSLELCWQEGRMFISHDTETDSRVDLTACRAIAVRSLIVAPLVSHKPLGALKILANKPNVFNQRHIKLLELMAGFMVAGLKHHILFHEKEDAVLKLRKAYEHLSYIAKHDFLTKLPTKKIFDTVLYHTMEKVKRKKGLIALMYLDIAHFKWINERYGHSSGDKILVRFAAYLKKSVRKYDFVVRIAGDEFIILFDDLREHEDALRIADKIINNSERNLVLSDHQIKISINIGISFYHGESLNPTELIKQAHETLQRMKQKDQSGFAVFQKSF